MNTKDRTEPVQFWVKYSGDRSKIRLGDGLRAVKWIRRGELKNHLVFPNQWENAEKVIEEFREIQENS